MMGSAARAFNGDVKLKDTLIAGFSGEGQAGSLFTMPNPPEDEVTKFCETFGIGPALFHLAHALRTDGQNEVDSTFFVTLFNAIPLSCDTDRIISDWLFWLWEGVGDNALCGRLAGTDASAPATALMMLHRSDAQPSRKEWRQARNAVLAVTELSLEARGAAEIVATMGWDLQSTPAAVGDIVSTIYRVRRAQVDEAMEWNTDCDERFRAAFVRTFNAALEEVGVPSQEERSDQEAMKALSLRARELARAKATPEEEQITRRGEQVQQAKQEAVASSAAAMRHDLIAIAGAQQT